MWVFGSVAGGVFYFTTDSGMLFCCRSNLAAEHLLAHALRADEGALSSVAIEPELFLTEGANPRGLVQ